MKRFILFLLIAIAVSGCKFLESIISEYGIDMSNLSNNEVVVWGTYDQTNGTRLPNERPMCEPVRPTEDMSRYYSTFIMSESKAWPRSLSNTDTVRVFVLDKKQYDETDWDTIRDQYLILQRYDFAKADLNFLGWHIAYPPTPEMKDIKMWPSYEEAIKNAETLK